MTQKILSFFQLVRKKTIHMEERVFMIKTNYKFGESLTEISRKFSRNFKLKRGCSNSKLLKS